MGLALAYLYFRLSRLLLPGANRGYSTLYLPQSSRQVP